MKKIAIMSLVLASNSVFAKEEQFNDFVLAERDKQDKQTVWKKVLKKTFKETLLEELHASMQQFPWEDCNSNPHDEQCKNVFKILNVTTSQEAQDLIEEMYKANNKAWFEKMTRSAVQRRFKKDFNFTLFAAESKLLFDCQNNTSECPVIKKAIADTLESNKLTEEQLKYALRLQDLTNQ